MSHVTSIEMDEVESYDIQTLKQMCVDEGWEWREGQRTYKSFYGQNSCQHAIRVPGASYEIGVVEEAGKTKLKWDSFSSGGLTKALGPKAERLRQAYAVAKVKVTAKRHGKKYWTKESSTPGWKRVFVEV